MNDTFLKACRGEVTPYTPVWIMRQNGRYLPEYRKIHQKYGFLTTCKEPELAAQVALHPVEVLGVDAAIIRSDILTTVEPMGMKLEYSDATGPVFQNPIRSKADIDRLVVPEVEDSLSFVMEAVRLTVRELENKVPLIGFAGAPFTVAAYMIDGMGGSNLYRYTKRMLFTQPQLLHSLLDKITRLTTAYLRAQVRAGAASVMLFDSWTGLLTPRDYTEFALGYVRKIIEGLKTEKVPVLYIAKGCSAILEKVKESGADVIGIDYRINLNTALEKLGQDVSIQGNLDPSALLMPRDQIEVRVKEILSLASGAKGHIFNLGDGILDDSPVENVIAMVEAVHKISRK